MLYVQILRKRSHHSMFSYILLNVAPFKHFSLKKKKCILVAFMQSMAWLGTGSREEQ